MSLVFVFKCVFSFFFKNIKLFLKTILSNRPLLSYVIIIMTKLSLYSNFEFSDGIYLFEVVIALQWLLN